MKGLSALVLCMVMIATNAYALSPPWWTVQKELDHSVGASSCVEVGEVNEDQEPYTIDVTACSNKMASALAAVLRKNWSFGDVHLHIRVLNPSGQEIKPRLDPGDDPAAAVRARFQTVLAHNPLFSTIRDRRDILLDPHSFWIEIKKKVVQFFNDDLGDYYGNKNMIAGDAFQRVLRSSFFEGTVLVGWTTAPDAP